jgi:PiT family inorganic phosphate transporter
MNPDGLALRQLAMPRVVFASNTACDNLVPQVRVSFSASLDKLRVLSAMLICFARALNDTPKLTALLIAAHLLDAKISIALIGALMAIGGLLFARKVAETMSQRVTRMDHAQALAANLITPSLVRFASKFGMPVSTTHVAVDAIAGLGASANTLNWHALRNIYCLGLRHCHWQRAWLGRRVASFDTSLFGKIDQVGSSTRTLRRRSF